MIVVKILGFLGFLLLSGHAWGEYNLTVVHISDFHSHWFEFNDRERKCSDEESKAGKCFGGFPRLLNLVRDIRKKEKNVIVLSSGEFFLGRSLNSLHGWKIANALLPKLDLDAMSLSNHDFSNGIFELSTFLYGMNFPVLCANMWARETSFLYSRVNKSAVLDINGEKIGIVGYTHPETLEKSRKAASVKFFPEIPAIKKEVERLESYGINKIIALGHSGYYTDLDIAKNVKGVNIVIGGNSDIVIEVPYHDEDEVQTEGNIHGNYPRVHHPEYSNATEAELKNRTLVLHIPQHGKYVGVIRVTFDERGRIIHEEGKPVLLDSSIPQDAETLNYLKNVHSILEEVTKNVRLPDDSEVLAQAEFEFESRKCRMQECSLGNLVTDAMLQVYQNNKHVKKPSKDPEKWGHVDAVVFNAGSIRYPLPAGNITIKDLVHSLFVGDFMKIVYMDGEQMVKMMEHSVEKYDPTGVTAPGSFLQISGLRVLYDLSNSPGNRVKKLLVRCENCAYDYKEVDPQKTYFVAMPEFISRGGDGYPRFQKVDPKDFGQPEILLIVQHLRKMKIIKPVLDGRISFLNELYPKNYATFTKPKVSNILSTASTKNMDSSMMVQPTQGPEKKIVPTSTIAKSERKEIRPNPIEKQTIKKNKSTFRSLSSEFEKINSTSEMTALEKDIMNSTSIRTTGGTQKINSTTLVTPQSVTKSMERKYNHSKIYHVEMGKSYSYVSLMLGRDLEYPTEHTSVERFLKSGNKSVSEKKSPNENFPGITTETKPGTENTTERDTILSLKDDDVRHTANLSPPVKRKTEENTKNILVQNHATASSTRQNLDPSIHITAENSSMEKTWYGNDTANMMNNSSPIELLINNTDSINEFASPDLVANFIIGEGEVFDVVLKEESAEDTTNSQEVSSASINSSEETPSQKNYSKLYEVKSKFSSLVKNSSLSELEKVLINAALAEVTENAVIIDDGDLERISDNLKAGMSSFLQDKIAVTTMTSVDGELATIIRDHFDSVLLNATQSLPTEEPSTETNSMTQTPFTEALAKESIQASTETDNDKKQENNRILNGSITNATDDSVFQNLSQISDLNKKHVNEIKDLLVNSVVNSVLDKMKTEIGHKLMDVNSSDIDNNSEDIVLKNRRVVKKQLKSLSEEMISSTAGKFKTDSTVLTSTHDSETNTETHAETTKVSTGEKWTGSKITAEIDNQQKVSVMKSSSQDQAREDNHKAEIDLVPWKRLGFK
ncbi:5'-nucleotidase [Araneus ventricosus]|uniref:5'-nucleotidase n=1 Tax=Araneus ventricosus TaxID=182803 RepID=A0A4Y2HPZ7_ARAVE|nr:5'-nucleotidase [Araneus ventricosus]